MGEISNGLELGKLEKKVDDLRIATENMGCALQNSINGVSAELKQLQEKFLSMMDEQKKSAALQQASTELVRVRQELEQNYGNYKVVRETMLGVLQATDLALVKKTTISRVSEELMLSTPKYWLAPCLVAVAAWIGNDKDLAERAIAEAVKRDEERTALTMALICRRNNRVQTCYEWLSIYFADQDAANFSEGSFTYIDAYVNGIFGPDDKHMCDDYINRWMNEVRGSSSLFEKEQEEQWKEYCDKFHCQLTQLYPDLKDVVQEYDRIDNYVGRIHSVDSIKDNFTGIIGAYVDQEHLKKRIDKNLINLVSRYDEEEIPLRKEEEYLKAVKAHNGDADAARHTMEAAEKMRQVKALNLVQQMSNVITTEKDVSPSERKTAVSFLSSYIKKGFNTYLTENREQFPNQITLNLDGWNGTTTDGNNATELCKSYEDYINQCEQKDVLKETSGPAKIWTIVTIAVAVLAVISLIFVTPLGVILALGGIGCAIKMIMERKKMKNKVAEINQYYANLKTEGTRKINACTVQWKKAKEVAEQFDSESVHDIIA